MDIAFTIAVRYSSNLGAEKKAEFDVMRCVRERLIGVAGLFHAMLFDANTPS